MSHDLKRELLEMNGAYSSRFAAQSVTRELYQNKHPTNIATFKCMDGRVNLAELTRTPIGTIYPFRNIGGKFDLGWSPLNAQVIKYVKTSLHRKGRKVLFLVTYHYAQGCPERGCRGHDYDVDKAIGCARRLVDQIRKVFQGQEEIYALMVGVETDDQALIFHGRDGRRVSMADLSLDEASVLDVILELYPDINHGIVPDLLPLMLGNIRHVREIGAAGPARYDREHRESIIAVGNGNDWISPNRALTINDLELTLDDTIGVAAGIIMHNIESGRVPGGRPLLLGSVAYKADEDYDRLAAVERARFLTRLGLESVRKFQPELDGAFDSLTCIMRWQDRRVEVIDD